MAAWPSVHRGAVLAARLAGPVRQVLLFAGAYWSLPTSCAGLVLTATPTSRSATRARSSTSSARCTCSSSRASRPGRSNMPGSSTSLDWMYLNAHFVVTSARSCSSTCAATSRFYFVRNMFMVAMGLALVGYVVYPTAPPRLMPEWGFTDSVAQFTGVDRSTTGRRKRAGQPLRRGPLDARRASRS